MAAMRWSTAPGPGDRGLPELDGIVRKADRDDRFDVGAHGGLVTAHHADRGRQQRDGAPRPLEQAVGVEACPRLGDQRGDRSIADREDLLGDELQLAPVGDPFEATGDGDAFARHDATPRPARRRHAHGDLGDAVAAG